jgi:hypothetical protein
VNRIANIAAMVKKKTTSTKKASGSLNPTAFEKDFISAAMGKDNLKFFQSERSKTVADKCISNLKKFSGEINGAKTHSTKTASGESVLSAVYKEFMCGAGGRCNGDAKSDVVLSTQSLGTMKISMKKQGEAQIASAQVGEANAVISAALGKNNEIVKAVRNIIKETMSRDSYYGLRNQYERKYGLNSFNKDLADLIGIKTSVSTVSTADIAKFNRFIARAGIQSTITQEMTQFMSRMETKKKLFLEFASGERRFVKRHSDRAANWMMTWSETGTIDLKSVEDFVNSNMGSFRFNIRDRGEGGGGSVRLAIREAFSLSPEEYKTFMLLENRTTREIERHILTEGILDSTVDLLKTAGSAVANLYKAFVKAIKNIMSMITRLFAKGTASVLEFFGLEVEEMTYTW